MKLSAGLELRPTPTSEAPRSITRKPGVSSKMTEQNTTPPENVRINVSADIFLPSRTLLAAWGDTVTVHIYMAEGQLHAFYRERYGVSKHNFGATLLVSELMLEDHYSIDPLSASLAFCELLTAANVKLDFMEGNQEFSDRGYARNAPYYYPIARTKSSTPPTTRL